MKNKKNLLYLLYIIPIFLVIFIFNVNKPSTITKADYQNMKIIKVYVFGEVLKPGSYYFNNGSTFEDLLKRSGTTDNSYIEQSILNTLLIDGESYEVSSYNSNFENELTVNQSNLSPSNNSTSLVNINKDDINTLITLPSIGSTRANAIIYYRSIKEFESKEEVMNVKGISQSVYDKIKDYITI